MLARRGKLRSLQLFMLAAVIAVSSVLTYLMPSSTNAATRPEGVAFFNNVYVGSSTRAVIWYDGSPYGGNSLPMFYNKTDFINHIKWLRGGDGSSWQWRNQTGAEYIIQRMRAGNDFSRPDAADVADWESRIMQSNVTIANEITTDAQTSGFITLGGYDGGADTVANRDDVAYTKSSGINTDMTLAFYQNGSLVFRIRYNCGNPLGNLNGITSQNFDLTPSISGSPDVAETGTSISLNSQVYNGGTTSSATAQWRVSRFQVTPGGTVPGGGTNGSGPGTHFGTGTTNFGTVSSGSTSFPINYTPIGIANQTLGDLEVGTKQCYALSVQPVRHDNSNWRHSTPFCVTVAKKPKLQVEGGDVYVGKGSAPSATAPSIVTSIARKTVSGTALSFGSWGEYAIAATGNITGMASGAGYSQGNTSTNMCAVSYLTITNAGANACSASTVKGQYGLSATLPDMSARFTNAQNTGATINVATVTPNRVYTRNGGGTLTVNASADIAAGRWVVINAPNTDVVISSNIRYTGGTLTSIDRIPQIVIIANSIEIDSSVSQIDAWLIASGTSGRINTCRGIPYPLANNATNLNSETCDTPLVVNGPVIARQLILYRTAGSGTGLNSGAPAETFNLRPDAYLWATNFNSAAGRIPTVSTKELPPRF